MASLDHTDRSSDPAVAAGGAASLPLVVAAVQAAGSAVKSRFSANSRPGSRNTIVAGIGANDALSMEILRPALEAVFPGAGWAEENGSGALPSGEWWVVDPVKGAINHVHGMIDWGITATLVRDNVAVLTAIHLPLTGDTYTALRGSGAHLDGVRLRPSAKTELDAALVGTGQALPGEGSTTYRRIGRSVTAMLGAALVVHVSVPGTLQLIQVAAGQRDVFWQFGRVRAGLMAGALLVEESGGQVTDIHGRPWSVVSADILAAASGVHAAAVSVLSEVG